MRLFLAFLGFILLILVGVLLISSHHKKPAPTQVVKTLPDYATTDSQVTMIIDGPVNGDDVHRAVRVTVSGDSRSLDIIQGYSGNIIESHSQNNTADAYRVFLKALDTANYLAKLSKPTGPDNPEGQCPTGNRVSFSLTNDGDSVSDLWSSTCGTGDFAGDADLAQQLFQDQITNYSDLTANVEF